jgi:sugar phosphate isomerase/epimerase
MTTARIPAESIGTCLYTQRDRIAAAPDATGVPYGFERVLARLAEIGFQHVEFAGYEQSTEILGRQITPAEIRTILDDNGLRANGTHATVPSTITDETLDAFDAELEVANILGTGHVGTGADPSDSRYKSDWDIAIERWNTLGARARAAGLKLYTHNHDRAFDFLLDRPPLDSLGRPTRSSGVRLDEYLLEQSDAELVFLELDVYWAFVAQHRFREYTDPDGVVRASVLDPAELVERHPNRVPLLHAKDGRRTPDPPGVGAGYSMVPFGTGDIDYPSFFSRIGGGDRFANYEQDDAPGGADEPGRSLAYSATSYANLVALGREPQLDAGRFQALGRKLETSLVNRQKML